MQTKGFIPEHYNPVEYWNTRDQPNTGKNPGISKAHRDFFRRHITPGMRVVELGPGTGRLFELYKGAAEICTLDLTQRHYKAVGEAALNNALVVRQEFLSQPLDNFPFADGYFDVGVSSYVFIHVPFENIRHSMSEMARVARRTIVFVGINPIWPKTEDKRMPSSHCFAHDYDALAKELGCKIFDHVEQRHANNPETGWRSFVYGKV